uniref:C-type lectin domain-containing protein n=1 Tax=Sinocyclocheilus anshuiensis TaxID=1608454 RepID=A0A671KN06_9TELE
MTFTGLLLFVLYGLTTNSTGVKVHIHVTASVTCADAQNYCKEFYKNLSIVSNNEDLQMLEEAAGGTYGESWINSQEHSCKALKSENTNTSAVEYLLDNPPFYSVWTGLCFLNGNWNWLNVINDQNNLPLPSCPPEPHRCGARNTKKEQWKNSDCEEKLNFLCLHN